MTGDPAAAAAPGGGGSSPGAAPDSAPGAAPLIHLSVEEEAWSALPDPEALCARAAAAAFRAAGIAPEGWAVSLLLTSDDAVATLNRDHRGKTGPTNVLSWPAWDLAPDTPGAAPADPGAPDPMPGETAEEIGDLALAHGVCMREAEAAGLPLADHVTHLVLHGVLHCLGYDHLTEADAALMEGLESGAMLAMGLRDPYMGQAD